MKRIVLAALATATLGFAGPAFASSVPINTLWYPQTTAVPAYTTATVIQDFSLAPGASGTPYVAETLPGFFRKRSRSRGGTSA